VVGDAEGVRCMYVEVTRAKGGVDNICLPVIIKNLNSSAERAVSLNLKADNLISSTEKAVCRTLLRNKLEGQQ
jgi:hypothetical protein